MSDANLLPGAVPRTEGDAEDAANLGDFLIVKFVVKLEVERYALGTTGSETILLGSEPGLFLFSQRPRFPLKAGQILRIRHSRKWVC